ncbi:MAG TPA: hypothetical protein VJ817_13970 [Gemmatimonadales bacterium]|nr:hypothetical protein [Gemmatimonadales bacterium]
MAHISLSGPLLLFALVATGAGQGPGPVSRVVVPPGVSCTAAQLEAGAKPDSNTTQGVTPPVQKRPYARPKEPVSPLAGPDTTLLRFVVDTTGAIDPCSMRVLQESSRWWTESVAEVVFPARFVPAKVAGRAIRYVITFRYRYQ